jgi:hypothetical protein
MMTAKLAIAMAVLACCAAAESVGNAPAATPVTIYCLFDPGAIGNLGLFTLARVRAESLLADAGVRLEWRRGKPAAGETNSQTIEVTFVGAVPESRVSKLEPSTLALARPYRSRHTISVFCDRVAAFLQLVPHDDRPAVLGHILAHEIVHVLQGAAQHSDTGLMMARWTRRELSDMTAGGLPMSPEDRELVRLGLARTAVLRAPRGPR